MATDQEMRSVSTRIEALVAELEALPDAAVRSRVEELVRLLLRLHGEGLARMLTMLEQQPVEAIRDIDRFTADPVVASLLMLHDLHPHDLHTRIGRALDLLRPNLGPQSEVTLLSAADDLVRVRLDLPPNGCGTSLEGLRASIRAAIRDAAPDVREVLVEAAIPPRPPALIQVTRG